MTFGAGFLSIQSTRSWGSFDLYINESSVAEARGGGGWQEATDYEGRCEQVCMYVEMPQTYARTVKVHRFLGGMMVSFNMIYIRSDDRTYLHDHGVR